MEVLEKTLQELGYSQLDITEILIPCPLRLTVQEQILEKIEPGILQDPDLNIPGISQVNRLSSIYADLGIQSTNDIVIGNCSQKSSLDLLLALCQFCETPEIKLSQTENLISFIAASPNIFNSEIKIFPATFPQKYNICQNNLSDMIQILNYWKQEYQRLENYRPKSNDIKMVGNQDLIELRRSIDEFCKEIKRFRKIYECELRNYLGESREDNKGIGTWSKACIGSYLKLESLFKSIESIWSSINILTNNT